MPYLYIQSKFIHWTIKVICKRLCYLAKRESEPDTSALRIEPQAFGLANRAVDYQIWVVNRAWGWQIEQRMPLIHFWATVSMLTQFQLNALCCSGHEHAYENMVTGSLS